MSEATTVVDELRDLERRRLQSLVDGNLGVAATFHADDYELITPGGTPLSKEEYLEGIAEGTLNYQVFEADSEITVRLAGDGGGILRYRARIEIDVSGERDEGLFWHTDYYERRQGRWQAVWSQATRINS